MSGENITRLPCPTCTGPGRQTVGMVCPTCGTDYGTTAGDQLTAQLAEALHAGIPELSLADCALIAGAALPVVRRYGDQRAAEALESVLDGPRWVMLSGALYVPADVLRDGVAALRGKAGR